MMKHTAGIQGICRISVKCMTPTTDIQSCLQSTLGLGVCTDALALAAVFDCDASWESRHHAGGVAAAGRQCARGCPRLSCLPLSRSAVESRRLPSRVNWASAPSSGRKTSATAKQDPVEAEAEGTLLL